MEYLNELYRACGIAVVAVVCIAVVGRTSQTATLALRLGAGVLLFSIFVMLLGKSVAEINVVLGSLGSGSGSTQVALSVMLKAAGVAVVSRFCADVCRDCGESSLASGVESVGRAVMIAMCIPIVADVLKLAADVLERGT
jgi:stage III sporulation protein AD